MTMELELDAALFFNDLPGAYPIYCALRDAVLAAYPARWTTRIVLGAPEAVDAELLYWVDEAYAFAAGK